jgi:hypothetical protein
VAFAVELERWSRKSVEGKRCVLCPLIESFAVDFVALAETAARYSGEASALAVRVGILALESQPLVAVDHRRYGPGHFSQELEIVEGSRQLGSLRELETELPSSADAGTLHHVAKELSTDLLNQFGVQRLSVLS